MKIEFRPGDKFWNLQSFFKLQRLTRGLVTVQRGFVPGKERVIKFILEFNSPPTEKLEISGINCYAGELGETLELNTGTRCILLYEVRFASMCTHDEWSVRSLCADEVVPRRAVQEI